MKKTGLILVALMLSIFMLTGTAVKTWAEDSVVKSGDKTIVVKDVDNPIFSGGKHIVKVDLSNSGRTAVPCSSVFLTSTTEIEGWSPNSETGRWEKYIDEEVVKTFITQSEAKNGIVTLTIDFEAVQNLDAYKADAVDGFVFYIDFYNEKVDENGKTVIDEFGYPVTIGESKPISFTVLDEATTIAEVEKVLNALKPASQITLSDEQDVVKARETFDKLSETMQKKINEDAVKKLTEAEAKIKDLKDGKTDDTKTDDTKTDDTKKDDAKTDDTKTDDTKKDDAKTDDSATDKEAAAAVEKKIDALPAPDKLTLDNEAAVTEAASAFDALTDAQKALIPSDKAQKLTDAKAKIASIKTAEKKDKASEKNVEKTITAYKNETDPKDAASVLLQPKLTAYGSYLKLSYKKVSGAKKYVIYAINCGKKNKLKKLTTTKKTSVKITKVNKKKLKKNTYYKVMVTAVGKKNGYDKVLAKSRLMHAVMTGGKYTNPAKVTKVPKTKTLKAGKSYKIKAKYTLAKKKLKILQHVGIRYESSNTKVATVDKTGKVKAKKAGKANIYVYAQNGVSAVMKLTVKK